ncbi:MAG: M20 family metallo-hydrolase [Kofleriaceae bacterium]|nr:M20 family metallo-hydrolase [Kofleriaceae bacterium]
MTPQENAQVSTQALRINGDRLSARLRELALVGGTPDGGVCRLALTPADKEGRDLVITWMRELGMSVSIDKIGNVMAVFAGREEGLPVTMGSHIDTVATGGAYDGNLGVLAGLEVVRILVDAKITPRYPIAVAFFTNEEGARFAPDMMGSGVQQGALSLETSLATVGIDGTTVADDLQSIGYAGDRACDFRARNFLELHIEQGPVLERDGVQIGAVEGVQGISWTEVTLHGVSNHAGTTPMSMRNDAAYVAAAIAVELRAIASDFGEPQVATVGSLVLEPNLINVVARKATLTLDLRNTDEAVLQKAEARAFAFVEECAAREGVRFEMKTLARFEPVTFSPDIIGLVEATAKELGASVKRMPSGAGHDAQMFVPNCPSGMIFVPSAGGISHNIKEHTDAIDIERGANVLLQVLLTLVS